MGYICAFYTRRVSTEAVEVFTCMCSTGEYFASLGPEKAPSCIKMCSKPAVAQLTDGDQMEGSRRNIEGIVKCQNSSFATSQSDLAFSDGSD